MNTFPFAFPAPKQILAAYVNRQEDIACVCALLPGRYRFAQVEAAINASGVHPRQIYESQRGDRGIGTLL